jgi:hypothetical protein
MGQCEFSGKVRKPVTLLEYKVAKQDMVRRNEKTQKEGKMREEKCKSEEGINGGGRGDDRAEV